jgi:hypothetical protein
LQAIINGFLAQLVFSPDETVPVFPHFGMKMKHLYRFFCIFISSSEVGVADIIRVVQLRDPSRKPFPLQYFVQRLFVVFVMIRKMRVVYFPKNVFRAAFHEQASRIELFVTVRAYSDVFEIRSAEFFLQPDVQIVNPENPILRMRVQNIQNPLGFAARDTGE